MRVLQRGHRYELTNRDGTGKQIIQYVNKEPGHECEGVTQQEVLRMLIDRNRYCTACQPDLVSESIEKHLQMALVLHESRALIRKVEKGEIKPEYIDQGGDGHFKLTDHNLDYLDGEELNTEKLVPYTPPWERGCNHHCGDAVTPTKKIKQNSLRR